MNSRGETDEESAMDHFSSRRYNQPYRDDPDDSDVDVDVGNLEPDAPLQASRGSPSAEFDDIGRQSGLSWQDRLARRIPPRLKTAWRATKTWAKGPQPPRIYKINPFFPKIQHAPIDLLDRYAPSKTHRFWLLILLYAGWLLAFSLVLRSSSFSAAVPGYGAPFRLGCTARYWSNGNGCGLNGDECRPFQKAHLAFRCPAECADQQVFTPHAVGDQEVVYKPLVVGGPMQNTTEFGDEIVENAIYRGDSFICGAAVHAGFINDRQGGCGVLTLTGEQHSFQASERNGIGSFGFDSYFPQSFGFLRGTRAECKDLRWPALAVTVCFTTLLSIFTTSPGVFFWSMFVMLFATVGLATDPPSLVDYRRLVSVGIGRFLPAAFCAWVTYRYSVKRSLTDLTAQIEKTILWLGPAWVGALNNYTFDKIPIQRLTPHDIQAQPGAIPALIIIILSLIIIALGQAWAFRLEGRMPRYLLVYGILVGSILILLTIPSLSLRIHHYILALLFLPGTSFQNRPSLVYQGLLTGLFINGIARWGFAPIVELPGDLLEGIPTGTLLPAISILAIGARNITFNLGPLPVTNPKSGRTFDGISILVNDVERFRGYDSADYWPDGWVVGGNYTWTWRRHKSGSDETASLSDDERLEAERVSFPEYFRFAYLSGSDVGDYTRAGRWHGDGNWTQMEPGPS